MKKITTKIIAALLMMMMVASCKTDAPKLEVMDTLGGDFTLTDHNGKLFNMKDLRGKVVLLFFGYTNCPDVCPLTLAKIAVGYKKLGSQAEEVKTVFISVDPQRDTQEKLKQYLSYFTYGPIGLSGTQEQLGKVSGLYKTLYLKRLTGKNSGYLFDHSTATFLIDKEGRVRHLFGQNDRPDTIAKVIKVLLKAG